MAGAVRPGRIVSFWSLVYRVYITCMLHISISLPSTSLNVRAVSPDMVRVSAVTGGDATLPCDTREHRTTDVLLLIVWYKNDTPIYSYDGRVKGPSAHWADNMLLNGRAQWHSTPPSSLRIRDVIPTDRGLYRCRVDYKVSPTINQKILLDVIELPEKPKIFDEDDKEIVDVAGPYIEESSTKLTCAVSGGKPAPRVRWWRNDQVISTLVPVDDGSRLSFLELRIDRLTRSFYEAVYTCTADNTVLVPPLRVNVQIQLYLRPLSVEIPTHDQPLAVDQKAELECKATGARPPAVITWWIDNVEMTPATLKVSDDRNESLSVLRWTPRMDHNGMTLTCRAAHAILEHATIETSITLNLHYAPIVTLKLGSNLNPNDIEEGDDVYFDCIVNAHPPAYKVVWEHNGQVLSQSQRAGIIATSNHVVLQKVSREQAGKYACVASNVEGDGRSDSLSLQVIYKPMCKLSISPIVGAAINESARVTCEVDAFPPPQTFQWMLNNSVGTVEIEMDKFTIDDGRSILSFTPRSEADYGTLSCRATNLAGQQVDSCRYTLLPAVRPDRPYNCSTFNLTDDSVELRCNAGYDGGLHTIYFVEAWESRRLVLNVSTAAPVWKLRGLSPGKTVKLVFYAYNARGRSETTSLRIHTLLRLALQTDGSTKKAGVDVSWALGILSGITGTLVVVIIVVILVRKRRNDPIQYAAPSQTLKTYKSSLNSGNHSPLQPDDKNPDVVPLGQGLNVSRETPRPPDPPPYGAMVSPLVGLSKSAHSLHHDARSLHTPNTPASDAQSFGNAAEDRRSITSGTATRRREVVTTRTPLLANARESCV